MGYLLKISAAMLVAVIVLIVGVTSAKDVYYMDSNLDCSYIGVQDINRDQVITVHGKTTDTGTSTQGGCTLNFQTRDNDATVKVEFSSFLVSDCGVKLYVSGSGGQAPEYGCGDNPQTYFSIGRTVTITLHKQNINSNSYSFKLRVSARRDDRFPAPSDSNPIAVGMVVGIVGGVFGFIFIVLCVGICCFRKYRSGRPVKVPYGYNDSKARLDESSRSNTTSVGFTNESMRGSPSSKRKLLAPSDSSDERHDNSRPNMNQNRNRVNVPPPAPPPPPGPEFNSRNSSDSEKKVDLRNGTVNNGGKSAMLNALHSNSKFRNSFKENERDAEARAKRISTTSFEKLGDAPSPPSYEDSLSQSSVTDVPKSPKGKKSKLAGINRHPRPSSLSSEELNQIEKGRRAAARERDQSFSSDEPKNDNNKSKGKVNTTHSLKPDRKGPKGKKKKSQSVSSALDPEPSMNIPSGRSDNGRPPDGRSGPKNQKDRFLDANRDEPFEKMGSGRYSKRSNGRKSPRPGKNSGRGFSHRRGRSMEQLNSRPTTPTSMYGSMEDLEYLPPLQRASSKTSLYSSRSSLYDRRRRRKGSNSGSVVSYVRDDMSIGRHSRGYDDEFSTDEDDFDGYEKPLSRRDRSRMYRSENDLGRRVKEIATQTLRETATQTGLFESVTVENKRLVKKKKRSKSVSSSGTQTVKKEKKAKTKSTEKLDEIGTDSKSKASKAKRSKSVPDFTSTEEEEKPKPRPKPKPRKSVSADTHLDEPKKSASQENLAGAYYPQSEGFAPQAFPGQGYPMVPPPSYDQQQGMPPIAGYPGYPVQGQGQMQGALPQGYPGQPLPQGASIPTGYQGQGVPQGNNMPQGYPGQGVPPGYQMPPQQLPPQPPVQQAPRKPRKSNWEMLCEMTDGEYKRDDVTETGSIASSVFTNNPASMPGYNVGYQPQPNYNTNPQFYQPQQSNNHQVPPMQQNYSGNVNKAYVSTPPLDYENVDFHANKPVNTSFNDVKKSSMEMLKNLTDNSATNNRETRVQNARNESVV
ncbi:hypothetical protein ACF0H5_014136 [Mactra antiquata]